MKKLVVLFSVVAMVLLSFGCAEATDNMVSGVDYTDYGSSTLRINNMDNVDLVIFNGSLDAANVIGGVRGSKMGHGIKQPEKKMLHVINAVTLDDYKANLNNLTACKITSSEMVYVDSDTITVDMYGDNSGDTPVYVNNTTKYYVEVKTSSFFGPTLLVARPYENMIKYVSEGDYSLYPTVVIPIKNAEAVITGTRRLEDPSMIRLYGIYQDEGATVLSFTADGITSLKPSTSVIKVANNLVGKGGIYLLRGTTQLKSTLGRGIVNEGSTASYEIQGDTGDPAFATIANFQYNLPSGNTPITGSITQFTNGHEYLITIADGSTSITYVGEMAVE